MCWCPPRCGAPLRPPRGVVCPPVVGACPVCCPPLWWVLALCAGAPPRCCGPDRDHCYERLEATAPHRIHSLAPWRHQGSGHPHAYGSCVRRAGTVHAVIHSPQQAFSPQSSGAAASRSRSHSSATNTHPHHSSFERAESTAILTLIIQFTTYDYENVVTSQIFYNYALALAYANL